MALASITLSLDYARILRDTHGAKIRGASVHHTMGPHWREIVWIKDASGRKPYVCDNMTVAEIRRILCM